LSTRDTFAHRNSLLFAFFCRNSINLSVNKRLRWDLPETDPIRSENWKGTEKRARSIFCLGRLRSWRKSKPHSKWQIQRQFTLVRQLLEVDFGRVLRQKVKILGKTYAELCGSSSWLPFIWWKTCQVQWFVMSCKNSQSIWAVHSSGLWSTIPRLLLNIT